MEVFGITQDKTKLGQISFNGSDWSAWSFLGLPNDLLYKSAPTAVSTLPHFFHVFAADTDDNALTRRFNGTSWRPDIGWLDMGAQVADSGAPAALGQAWGFETDRYDLHTREQDGHLTTLYNNDDNLNIGQNYFPHIAKSPQVEGSSGYSSRELVFVGSDDYLYHYHWIGKNRQWKSYGRTGHQQLLSSPAVASNGLGSINVFGIAPDQTVVYNSFRTFDQVSGFWGGWKKLGGRQFASFIAAITPQGTNQIELWGLGLDGALWHRSGSDNNWPVDWTSHGGNFISAPALVSPAPGVYDVFAIDVDGAVKHARHTQTPDGWKPASGWESLGGSIKAFD